MNVGLFAPLSIHKLLADEKDVRAAVEAFIGGFGSDVVDVAGPPRRTELLTHYRDPVNMRFGLPTIRLHLRMTRHHLTGAPAVEIKLSDRDFEELAIWQRPRQFAA